VISNLTLWKCNVPSSKYWEEKCGYGQKRTGPYFLYCERFSLFVILLVLPLTQQLVLAAFSVQDREEEDECRIYIASIVVTADDGPTDIFPNTQGIWNSILLQKQKSSVKVSDLGILLYSYFWIFAIDGK